MMLSHVVPFPAVALQHIVQGQANRSGGSIALP